MAFKLIWSPSAKLDLKDITAFIAEDSISAAERFIGSLFQSGECGTFFAFAYFARNGDNPIISRQGENSPGLAGCA
jgi:hypothetical protein